jgi:L-iditol 2-dehydrogenase
MIAGGQLDMKSLLTHRFGLADIKAAFDTAEDGSAIKVALVND